MCDQGFLSKHKNKKQKNKKLTSLSKQNHLNPPFPTHKKYK